MRIKPIAAGALAVFALTLTACSNDDKVKDASAPNATAMTTSMAAMPMMAARSGEFAGQGGEHVSGTATIKDGKLELSNFASSQGPDLHVYLTKGAAESDVAAGKQISAVKYDQATQSFAVSGVNTDGYTTVVIHCDKAKVVFGAAVLK